MALALLWSMYYSYQVNGWRQYLQSIGGVVLIDSFQEHIQNYSNHHSSKL